MIGLKVDVGVMFGGNLREMARALGVTFDFLMKDQMRLFCLDMMKISAPSRKVIKAGTGNTDLPADRKIGEKAVFADLFKIFWIVPNDTNMAEGRKAKMAQVANMAQFHEANRRRNTGRTVRPRNGNAPDGRQMAAYSNFQKYAKSLYKHVGTLKAGWVKPARHYQSKVGGAISIPGWISRNTGRAKSGMYETRAGDFLQSITVVNSTNLAREKTDPGAIAAATRTRQRDIERNVIKRKDKIVEQFNASQRPQPALGAA